MRRSFRVRSILFLAGLAALGACGTPDLPGGARGQSAYAQHCASCHGASGKGSWRVWLFLVRPGDLTDARKMSQAGDQYLFDLIKNGGATIGKPGMPSFGFHLTDEEIRDLIAYVRGLARTRGENPPQPGSSPY